MIWVAAARHSRPRRTLLACLAAAVLIVGPAAAGQATPLYPTADSDPFYSQPADIADSQPGDVLGVRAMPPLAMFPDTTITLIQFRSTNSAGDPIAATTTVLQPNNHRPDAPVLSYQHIINGLGTRCSVSKVLYTDDPDLMVREAVAWNYALKRGWTMAVPDHLGPNFAYGAAKLGGQVTLDGIRAVRQVEQLRVAGSRVAMAGYSGGGMATAWAAALQPEYAPELEIAGAAMGGVPMNLVSMLEGLGFGSHPVFGLALAAGIGLEREYPQRFPISEQMNASGLAARASIRDACTNDILGAGAGRGILDFAATTSLVEDPEARAVVEENSLELYPGAPTMPVFEWHSPIDGLIPVEAITSTMHRWCAAGAKVVSQQTPTPDHLTAAVLGLPSALSWLDARLQGEPAPSTC
ncbi:lipase family protein [Nocardia sp. NPDC058705]|uniref:lipase family protein n=1 Tax=Nocardia sp. NPDC058705 TaxID=3346609 RepID=UPI0036796458